jgi:cyclic pyranopterin phosphate synthase
MTVFAPLIDSFGRPITYLRVSVTDRCNFRCHYCMAEDSTFLPRKDLLSLEELARLCDVFIGRGVRRIRLTGGEPLVRKGILTLVADLGRHVKGGRLDEVTLTTNGSQLAHLASDLYAAGVRRVNVSLDTRNAKEFERISRWGQLEQVLKGIDAALAAGLSVKINTVLLKGTNEFEIPDLIRWAHGRGMDITLIEVMPVGDFGADRRAQHLPLSSFEANLKEQFSLIPSAHKTGGPARYVRIEETGGRLGFITPLSHRFCESCNRVRLTCTGTLYTCLGGEDSADLRTALRGSESNDKVSAVIDSAIARKPKGHDFVIGRFVAAGRGMNVTGG